MQTEREWQANSNNLTNFPSELTTSGKYISGLTVQFFAPLALPNADSVRFLSVLQFMWFVSIRVTSFIRFHMICSNLTDSLETRFHLLKKIVYFDTNHIVLIHTKSLPCKIVMFSHEIGLVMTFSMLLESMWEYTSHSLSFKIWPFKNWPWHTVLRLCKG